MVPLNNWESVDLYGPMPSNKHVVVVKDIASRFSAAKLVTPTKCEKVILAGGGGGGGVLYLQNTENTELVPRGWWVPFTVIELVPRVLILQIIGQ